MGKWDRERQPKQKLTPAFSYTVKPTYFLRTNYIDVAGLKKNKAILLIGQGVSEVCF